MDKVNVTELRQNLPTWLDHVRRGETVLVTSRGTVIAELRPPVAAPDDVDAARARLKSSVLRYDAPFAPALDPDDWDANR